MSRIRRLLSRLKKSTCVCCQRKRKETKLILLLRVLNFCSVSGYDLHNQYSEVVVHGPQAEFRPSCVKTTATSDDIELHHRKRS